MPIEQPESGGGVPSLDPVLRIVGDYAGIARKLGADIEALHNLLLPQTCEEGTPIPNFSGTLKSSPCEDAESQSVTAVLLCAQQRVKIGNDIWLYVTANVGAQIVEGWILSTAEVNLPIVENPELYNLENSLSGYGLVVHIAVNGSTRTCPSPIIQQDLEILREALAIAQELSVYGIRFSGSPWIIEELRIIRGVVLQKAHALANHVILLGYYTTGDIDALAKQLFIQYYGNMTLQRINADDTNGFRAQNFGDTIVFSNSVFFNDDVLLDTNPAVLAGAGALPITASTLVGHEFDHTIEGNVGSASSTPIYYDGLPLDVYFHRLLQQVSYSLQNSYSINCIGSGRQFPIPVQAGTVVSLPNIDAGFTAAARSSGLTGETVADGLNAYLMGLYTIGPAYTCEENLAGLARREQGALLWQIVSQEYQQNQN